MIQKFNRNAHGCTSFSDGRHQKPNLQKNGKRFSQVLLSSSQLLPKKNRIFYQSLKIHVTAAHFTDVERLKTCCAQLKTARHKARKKVLCRCQHFATLIIPKSFTDFIPSFASFSQALPNIKFVFKFKYFMSEQTDTDFYSATSQCTTSVL